MKFGLIAVSDAKGAILAHSVQAAGLVLKKGRTLTASECAALAAAGVTSIMAAQLEADDVAEDIAAARIAAAIAGPYVRIADAATGRCNLFAERAGVALVARERLIGLNAHDEAVTIATVAPYARVSAGQMVATVKLITFAAAERLVARVESEARHGDPIVAVAPFQPKRVGLVVTKLPGGKANVYAKRARAVITRVEALGATLVGPLESAHEAGAVGARIKELAAQGCDPILLFGASAIVDRGDVLPQAVLHAGGRVVHLGMPVDPGNLLLLALLEDRTVIGVPSCAASPKENGFDWVLERCLAGIAVTPADIVAMAPGGLLMEIETRPQPRQGTTPVAQECRVGAVVLAAGRSTRMGARNKLLQPIAGVPVVRHTVAAVLASQARPVVVVTGHQQAEVAAALAGLDVVLVHNPDFASGMASSLAKGVAELDGEADGALVVLADMPRVTAGHLDALMTSFAGAPEQSICVPTHGGEPGNPVLWGAAHFAELMALSGDRGGKSLLTKHATDVVNVELATDAIFIDVDTPEALAAVQEVS
jgi:molybdenum cofactor cytidylyltransferase